MKKAQIAIFFLMGIIMLFALGFIFYIRSITSDQQTESTTDKTFQDLISSTPLRAYVQSCLDKSFEEALFLAGQQGGKIYGYQAAGADKFIGPDGDITRPFGFLSLPYASDGQNFYNVGYGVLRPELGTPSHQNVPEYPFTFSLTSDSGITNAFGNYRKNNPAKKSNLPYLCNSDGANAYDVFGGGERPCETYDAQATESSIQENLEKYVKNKTKECVNFNNFTAEFLSETKGYRIEAGEVGVEVLFGIDHVKATLNYSITMNSGQGDSSLKILAFTSKKNVRLKKVYDLALHMIKKDVEDIFFDFERDAQDLYDCQDIISSNEQYVRCLKEGMKVVQIKDVCKTAYNGNAETECTEGVYDDIVIINDTASQLRGQSYVFLFAVDNRIPALDYIDESVGSETIYYRYLVENYGKTPQELYNQPNLPQPQTDDFNIAVDVGQKIEIIPFAVDPDGDSLFYSYTGWKTPEEGGGINEWESSRIYGLTQKDASYTTTEDDVGARTVRVIVRDNEGLADYQDVTIYVRAPPLGEQT